MSVATGNLVVERFPATVIAEKVPRPNGGKRGTGQSRGMNYHYPRCGGTAQGQWGPVEDAT